MEVCHRLFWSKSEKEKASTLKALFQRTYIRYIVERYRIKNSDVLDELLDILASAIGGLTNPTKLCNTFESVKHVKVNRMTLTSYLEYLCESFLTEKASLYDIKGKRYIDSPSKYYFCDCGLRNAASQLPTNRIHTSAWKVIYNELQLTSSVDVGVVSKQVRDKEGNRIRQQFEVGFVAIKEASVIISSRPTKWWIRRRCNKRKHPCEISMIHSKKSLYLVNLHQ